MTSGDWEGANSEEDADVDVDVVGGVDIDIVVADVDADVVVGVDPEVGADVVADVDTDGASGGKGWQKVSRERLEAMRWRPQQLRRQRWQ